MIGCCGNWPEYSPGLLALHLTSPVMASPSLISYLDKRTGQLKQGAIDDFHIVRLAKANVAAGFPARSRCIDANPLFRNIFQPHLFPSQEARSLMRQRVSDISKPRYKPRVCRQSLNSVPERLDTITRPSPSWRLPPWRWTATSKGATPRNRQSKHLPPFSMLPSSKIYPEACSRFKPLERRSTQLHFEHASSSLLRHLKPTIEP